MMKGWWSIVAVLAVLLAARPSNVCELLYRSQFPNPAAVRLTGSVLGHAPLAPTAAVASPTVGPQWQGVWLRIGVREIVSGVVAAQKNDRGPAVLRRRLRELRCEPRDSAARLPSRLGGGGSWTDYRIVD